MHETAPIGFARHDHASCVAHRLSEVERACAASGLRLTPIRRRVLELLLAHHRALGAYAILERLAADGQGVQPPTVYRALDFLLAHGFVHRVERLNAYVACTRPGTRHAPALLVCRACQGVAEADGAAESGLLDSAARAAGFEMAGAVIEAEGLCPDCAGAAP